MKQITTIDDNNTDFEKVKFYPVCKEHGAMNKVSEEGYWRCLQGQCRAGCIIK